MNFDPSNLRPREELPPEAASFPEFEKAVEEMIRAFNIIAKYDSAAMAREFNRHTRDDDPEWELGPLEDRCWPAVIVNAQRIRNWILANPELLRMMHDLRTISIDWAPGDMPEGLQ